MTGIDHPASTDEAELPRGLFALPHIDAPNGIQIWGAYTDHLGRPHFEPAAGSPGTPDRDDAARMIAANPALARAIYAHGRQRCTYCGEVLRSSRARHRGTCWPCAETKTPDELADLAGAIARLNRAGRTP